MPSDKSPFSSIFTEETSNERGGSTFGPKPVSATENSDSAAYVWVDGEPQRELVIIGEGNTSCKIDDGSLWIKASGHGMENIGSEGLVAVNTAPILEMLANPCGKIADMAFNAGTIIPFDLGESGDCRGFSREQTASAFRVIGRPV